MVLPAGEGRCRSHAGAEHDRTDDEITIREGLPNASTSNGEIKVTAWTGAWTHVVLDAELGKDATLALGERTTSISLRAFAAEKLTFTLGESGESDSFGYEVLFDNVACTFTP